MIAVMWIALDPENPRRRTAFGTEHDASGFAAGLTPPWVVRAADDPDEPLITVDRSTKGPPWHD